MKTSFTVQAKTARKEWEKNVASRDAADALAKDWTAKYNATCSIIVNESGFTTGGGRYDTSSVVGKTESQTAVDARHLRVMLNRCQREGIDASYATSLLALVDIQDCSEHALREAAKTLGWTPAKLFA